MKKKVLIAFIAIVMIAFAGVLPLKSNSIACLDLSGCYGAAGCLAGADHINGCEMWCSGGGFVVCPTLPPI